MNAPVDTAAERYFQQFDLKIRPVVDVNQLSELEKSEWPDGFGLELAGTSEQIEAVLNANDTGLPSLTYLDFLKHWGCFQLRGGWGLDFLTRRGNDKKYDGRNAVESYKPEKAVSSFRFHKDPSFILKPHFFDKNSEQRFAAFHGKGDYFLACMREFGVFFTHPVWSTGANFWSPCEVRSHASTLIIPEASFLRALDEHLPEGVQAELADHVEFFLSMVRHPVIPDIISRQAKKVGMLNAEDQIPELDEAELRRRLMINYYSNYMFQDGGRPLSMRPRTPQGVLDREISEACPKVRVDYNSPVIANWWEGAVMHKGVLMNKRSAPVRCKGLAYDTVRGIYY